MRLVGPVLQASQEKKLIASSFYQADSAYGLKSRPNEVVQAEDQAHNPDSREGRFTSAFVSVERRHHAA